MAADYRLDLEKRLVLTRYFGHVTDDDHFLVCRTLEEASEWLGMELDLD